MLTDDENIVDVQFAVQYILKSPTDYLFNNRSPDESVLQAAETAIRGDRGQEQHGFRALRGPRRRRRARAQADAGDPRPLRHRHQHQQGDDAERAAAASRCRRRSTTRWRPGRTASARRTKARPTPTTSSRRRRAWRRGCTQEAEGYRQKRDRAGGGRCRALPAGRRRIQQGAAGDARPPLHRGDAADHEQHHARCSIDQKGGNNLLYLPLDKIMQMSGAARRKRRSRRRARRRRSPSRPRRARASVPLARAGAALMKRDRRHDARRHRGPADHRVALAVRRRPAPERDRVPAGRGGEGREPARACISRCRCSTTCATSTRAS